MTDEVCFGGSLSQLFMVNGHFFVFLAKIEVKRNTKDRSKKNETVERVTFRSQKKVYLCNLFQHAKDSNSTHKTICFIDV